MPKPSRTEESGVHRIHPAIKRWREMEQVQRESVTNVLEARAEHVIDFGQDDIANAMFAAVDALEAIGREDKRKPVATVTALQPAKAEGGSSA